MNNGFKTTTSLGINKQCPVCKKKFIMHDSHAYVFKITKKGQQVPVCSWSCVRAYEKKNEGRYEASRRALIEKQLRGGL